MGYFNRFNIRPISSHRHSRTCSRSWESPDRCARFRIRPSFEEWNSKFKNIDIRENPSARPAANAPQLRRAPKANATPKNLPILTTPMPKHLANNNVIAAARVHALDTVVPRIDRPLRRNVATALTRRLIPLNNAARTGLSRHLKEGRFSNISPF